MISATIGTGRVIGLCWVCQGVSYFPCLLAELLYRWRLACSLVKTVQPGGASMYSTALSTRHPPQHSGGQAVSFCGSFASSHGVCVAGTGCSADMLSITIGRAVLGSGSFQISCFRLFHKRGANDVLKVT